MWSCSKEQIIWKLHRLSTYWCLSGWWSGPSRFNFSQTAFIHLSIWHDYLGFSCQYYQKNSPTLHYTRGAQLVFDWDRLENFLMTRDRPVGNKVTSTKCHEMQRFSFLCAFRNIDWKTFFLGILSIQCKIRRDRPNETRRSTCWSPCTTQFTSFI